MKFPLSIFRKPHTGQASPDNPNVPHGFEYRSYHRLRTLNLLSLSLIAAIVFGTGWFGYRFIYRVITQADAALILRHDPALRPIHFERYEAVKEARRAKSEQVPPGSIHNPFFVFPESDS